MLLVEEHDTNIIDSASTWVIDNGTAIHASTNRNIFGPHTL